MPVEVWHYDGQSAIRHVRALAVAGDGFRLVDADGDGASYLWSDLVRKDDGPAGPVFGLKGNAGWRIGFTGPVPEPLASHLPGLHRYGRWIDRLGFWRATGLFLGLSLAFGALILKAPDWLAPNIPFSWERRMGNAMLGDFGGRLCNGPGGQAALDALVGRLDSGRPPISVHVANIGMVNAVSLPGGNILVFRGLLQEAKSPEELAGVLGHEIGHVRKRHVLQALMRQAGLSVLLGGFGGNSGTAMNAMLAASYSRDAEAEADHYAIERLGKAKISPDDTAAFFGRMAQQEAKLGDAAGAIGYVSTHPLSKSRELAFRKSRVRGQRYAPVLDKAQWDALVDICHNDPKVKGEDDFFL